MLRITSLSSGYEKDFFIKDINFTLSKGERLSLVGASGSGKSTFLKALMGLCPLVKGQVENNGQDITHHRPYKRPLAMMFQEARPFPHMNVVDNILFGLKSKGQGPQKKTTELESLLYKTGLNEFRQRFPHELSGGQQQRVSLARALAVSPDILLLDEPFSALDPSLQLEMSLLTDQLSRERGISTIKATHSLEDALDFSDKVILFDKGAAVGPYSPKEILLCECDGRIAEYFSTGVIPPSSSSFIPFSKIKIEGHDSKILGKAKIVSTRLRPQFLEVILESDQFTPSRFRLFVNRDISLKQSEITLYEQGL